MRSGHGGDAVHRTSPRSLPDRTQVTAAAASPPQHARVNLRSLLYALLVIAALFSAWHRFELRPVHPRDGVLAAEDPRQSDPRDTTPVRHGRWLLTPRADYDITARILSREDYRFDAFAEISPEDLALGWGPMSDNQVLAQFEISQGVRFYEWRVRGTPPIPVQSVISHSANTHLIPADAAVKAQLARLRVGEVVRLTGPLVDGQRDDGASVHTSLTRLDSGPGACEILLVRSVELQ